MKKLKILKIVKICVFPHEKPALQMEVEKESGCTERKKQKGEGGDRPDQADSWGEQNNPIYSIQDAGLQCIR